MRRSLLELPLLLKRHVGAKRHEQVLRRILNVSLEYPDASQKYATPLQVSTRKEHPPVWKAPTIKEGEVVLGGVKSEDLLVRFAAGTLKGGTAEAPSLPGLIVDETSVILRTDNVLGEALLGQADALDQYALSLQREDIKSRSLSNRKLELGLDAIEAIAEPKDKVAAYEKMFGERPSIEIESVLLGAKRVVQEPEVRG